MKAYEFKMFALAAALMPCVLGAQDSTSAPAAEAAVVAEVVAETPAKADASIESANKDTEIRIDADEKVQEAFDAFLKRKTEQDPTLTAYGEPNAQGIIYYARMEPVSSKTSADPGFLKKRQTAFARAFQSIRDSYVKYSFRGVLVTGEEGSFLYDADAMKKQTPEKMDALQRLAGKVIALKESQVDQELQRNGVDPAQFNGMPAKRKALCRDLIRQAALRSFGTCTGVSVVKTVEGRGTDGAYTIGVIAKYDPQSVVIADCLARKVRPNTPAKTGIPVGRLLEGEVAHNFGTRLYYDEEGVPALLSFGQWSSDVSPGTDRFERKLLEKAAFAQAEAQANIDMNAFIAGHMTFEELTKAGETFEKSVVYTDDGVPAGEDRSDDITDLVKWNSSTTAKDTMAGRSRVFAKTLAHPDTGAMITVVAVNWSFRKLEQLKRDTDLRRPQQRPVAKPVAKPGAPALRQGDTYDF